MKQVRRRGRRRSGARLDAGADCPAPTRASSGAKSTRRYEWTEAGALLHIDAFELPKFAVVGHWAHGDRADRHRTRRAGKVKVIGVIDDRTRGTYALWTGDIGAALLLKKCIGGAGRGFPTLDWW